MGAWHTRGDGPRDYDLPAHPGMGEGAVKVAVNRLRKCCARFLQEEIAATLDDVSNGAVEEEIRSLFGVFAGQGDAPGSPSS